MTPITEAELLRMREVQVCLPVQPPSPDWIFRVVERHPRYVFEVEFKDSPGMSVAAFGSWMEGARTDWPRVTEWALEARRFLQARFHTHDRECLYSYRATAACDCGHVEARRLLGENT